MDAHLACLGTVTSSDAIEFRCDQQFAKWLKPLYKKRWVQALVSLKLGSPETKCHCLANSQAQDFGS